MDIKETVARMQLPTTNNYFEKSSADGYAFLGIARKKLGLDTTAIEAELAKRVVGLNEEWKRPPNITLPKTEVYVFTAMSCYEYYRITSNKQKTDEIIGVLDRIGRFKNNGMMRYCVTEIPKQVPNVSAIGALLYARHGRIKDTNELVAVLRKTQDPSGNWMYRNLQGVSLGKPEDRAHLAIIIMCLRELEMVYGIKTSDMVNKSWNSLRKTTFMGEWNTSFVYNAFKKSGLPEEKKSYDQTIALLTQGKNFRIRSAGAWSLVTGEDNGRGIL